MSRASTTLGVEGGVERGRREGGREEREGGGEGWREEEGKTDGLQSTCIHVILCWGGQ